MGKFRDIRWTWKSRDSDRRVGYLAVDGRVSLGELVDHLMQVAPHVSVFDLQLNWATVTWERDPTPDEIAVRRQQQARHDARHEQWERETYARLRAKFETPAPAPDVMQRARLARGGRGGDNPAGKYAQAACLHPADGVSDAGICGRCGAALTIDARPADE